MLSETEVSDSGYTSNDTSHTTCEISYGTSMDESEYEMETTMPPITIQIRNEIDSFSYPIVSQTKSIILPALYFLCIMSIFQLAIFHIHWVINNITILDIFHSPATFELAFNITLMIVIIVWVTLLYTEYKWSSVPIDVNIDNHSTIHEMKRLKSRLHHLEHDIHATVHEIHKLYYDDNELQLWSHQLLEFKEQLEAVQCKYKRKSKRKTFKNYIKYMDKQYEDVMHIIDENQFAILSAVLGQMQGGYTCIIGLDDYNTYLQLFNQSVINEFNFYGGFHGMKQNKDGTVEVHEFEQLIKKVM
eukprot:233269_1